MDTPVRGFASADNKLNKEARTVHLNIYSSQGGGHKRAPVQNQSHTTIRTKLTIELCRFREVSAFSWVYYLLLSNNLPINAFTHVHMPKGFENIDVPRGD